MALLDSTLRAMRVRRPPTLCTCLVCGRRVTERDERMALRAGGYVHRGCTTYRMRQVARRA